MPPTGAEAAAATLQSCGVTHVFGNPGTTELPFVNAIVASEISYVTCLHEDVAMGAAAGFATRARQLRADDADFPPLAVANVHTTPGVAHALGNLYGARFAHAPVLLTAGSQSPRHERRHPPLSGDRLDLVADQVKQVTTVTESDEIPAAIAATARTALRPPTGPAYLEFPLTVQEAESNASIPSIGPIPARAEVGSEAIADVTERLRTSTVTLVVGDDLARSGQPAVSEAVTLAEQLDAPVFGEPLYGELGFPTDHPHWVGMLPIDPGAIPSRLDTELVLFLGCTCPEPLLDYEPPLWGPDTSAIWIGSDEETVPAESDFAAILTGDLATAIGDIHSKLGPVLAADGRGVATTRDAHRQSVTTPAPGESQRQVDDKRRLAEAITEAAPEALIVDEGVTTGFLLRDLADLVPGRFLGQNSGGLGYGLPAAIGAAIAEETHGRPPRPVVALIGDGSYQYYPQAMYTAAQHVQTPLVVVVPDNGGYGILRNRDVIDEDASTDRPLTFAPEVDVVTNAASYGVRSQHVTDPADAEAAIAGAIDRGGIELVAVDIEDKSVP